MNLYSDFIFVFLQKAEHSELPPLQDCILLAPFREIKPGSLEQYYYTEVIIRFGFGSAESLGILFITSLVIAEIVGIRYDNCLSVACGYRSVVIEHETQKQWPQGLDALFKSMMRAVMLQIGSASWEINCVHTRG